MAKRVVLSSMISLSLGLLFASSVQAQGATKLESLIEQNGYYVQTSPEAPGMWVVWPARDIGVPVALSIGEVGGELVYLYTWILEVPAGYQHPPALLRKIAEINDRLFVGSVSLMEDGSIAYNSSFWLESATPDVLRWEVAAVNNIVPALAAEFEPFLNF